MSPRFLHKGFTAAITSARLSMYHDSNRNSPIFCDFTPTGSPMGFYPISEVLVDRPISQRFSHSSRRALAHYKTFHPVRKQTKVTRFHERKLFNLILEEEKKVLESKISSATFRKSRNTVK